MDPNDKDRKAEICARKTIEKTKTRLARILDLSVKIGCYVAPFWFTGFLIAFYGFPAFRAYLGAGSHLFFVSWGIAVIAGIGTFADLMILDWKYDITEQIGDSTIVVTANKLGDMAAHAVLILLWYCWRIGSLLFFPYIFLFPTDETLTAMKSIGDLYPVTFIIGLIGVAIDLYYVVRYAKRQWQDHGQNVEKRFMVRFGYLLIRAGQCPEAKKAN